MLLAPPGCMCPVPAGIRDGLATTNLLRLPLTISLPFLSLDIPSSYLEFPPLSIIPGAHIPGTHILGAHMPGSHITVAYTFS